MKGPRCTPLFAPYLRVRHVGDSEVEGQGADGGGLVPEDANVVELEAAGVDVGRLHTIAGQLGHDGGELEAVEVGV